MDRQEVIPMVERLIRVAENLQSYVVTADIDIPYHVVRAIEKAEEEIHYAKCQLM